MGLLRIAALVLFLLAGFAGVGWAINWTLPTVVGVIAFGLVCWLGSSLEPPHVPPRP